MVVEEEQVHLVEVQEITLMLEMVVMDLPHQLQVHQSLMLVVVEEVAMDGIMIIKLLEDLVVVELVVDKE